MPLHRVAVIHRMFHCAPTATSVCHTSPLWSICTKLDTQKTTVFCWNVRICYPARNWDLCACANMFRMCFALVVNSYIVSIYHICLLLLPSFRWIKDSIKTSLNSTSLSTNYTNGADFGVVDAISDLSQYSQLKLNVLDTQPAFFCVANGRVSALVSKRCMGIYDSVRQRTSNCKRCAVRMQWWQQRPLAVVLVNRSRSVSSRATCQAASRRTAVVVAPTARGGWRSPSDNTSILRSSTLPVSACRRPTTGPSPTHPRRPHRHPPPPPDPRSATSWQHCVNGDSAVYWPSAKERREGHMRSCQRPTWWRSTS